MASEHPPPAPVTLIHGHVDAFELALWMGGAEQLKLALNRFTRRRFASNCSWRLEGIKNS